MAQSRLLFKCLLISGLAAGAAAASALTGSIGVSAGAGPYSVGDPVTFSVTDGSPSHMCDTSLEVCAGDFRLGFDPTKLIFVSFNAGASLPSSASVAAGPVTMAGTWGAYLDVSVIPGGPSDTPTGYTELFRLTFTALAVPSATVYVDPTDFGVDEEGNLIPPTYAFTGASAAVGIVPEPATYALMALGLAALGGVARRRGRSTV